MDGIRVSRALLTDDGNEASIVCYLPASTYCSLLMYVEISAGSDSGNTGDAAGAATFAGGAATMTARGAGTVGTSAGAGNTVAAAEAIASTSGGSATAPLPAVNLPRAGKM